MPKKKRPFAPKKNRIEWHVKRKANGTFDLVRLTIRPNGVQVSATIVPRIPTREQADHLQLLKSRGH